MKNFEKYEEDIKKMNYCFGFNFKTKTITNCTICDNCLFYNEEYGCMRDLIIEWLYQEYTPKAQLTIEEIEELLKYKYPNGIEVVK